MRLYRVTVTDLIQVPESCDPTPMSTLPPSPTSPFEYATDPTDITDEVELDGTSVAYLGENARLGYLPNPSASSSAGSPAEPGGSTRWSSAPATRSVFATAVPSTHVLNVPRQVRDGGKVK